MKARFLSVAAVAVALVLIAVVALGLAGGSPALAQAATPRPGIVTPGTGTAAPRATVAASTGTPGTLLVPSAAVTSTQSTTRTNTAVGTVKNPPAGTITVVGEGKVSIKPDIARVNVGVENVSPTVKEASQQTKDAMDAVLAALKSQGIADKDIQTSGFSIYAERTGPGPQPADSKTAAADQTRYHVSNQVAITIRDLNQVSNVLDAVIEAGANNIYGVSFSVDDTSKVESQGRQAAVEDALRRASDLARLNGAKLGGVVSVSEVVGNQGGFVANSFRDAAAGKGGGGGGPIVSGELELTMQLQVTYAIE